MNHCDICGVDFYSDTDFEQDQQMHKIESMNKANFNMLHQLFSQLAIMNVLSIQRRDKCTYEQACETYFESQDILWSVTTKLRIKKWGR